MNRKIFSLRDPRLLCASALNEPLKVFLCGPGFSSSSFNLRQFLHDCLEGYPAVNAVFGEEIEERKRTTSRVDLQTLEARYAHSVDFTILMLDSPGSIAELGTFSMIPNIRSRLFVVLSSRFYGSESYIARGPLSLIASSHVNNIIYFDTENRTSIFESINLPVMMYKYARFVESSYYLNAIYAHRTKDYRPDHYENYFSPIRGRFFDALVLIAVIALYRPTFADIVNHLRLGPDDVNRALGRLFESKRIAKSPGGRYVAVDRYNDSLLEPFNKTEISRRRSHLIAVA